MFTPSQDSRITWDSQASLQNPHNSQKNCDSQANHDTVAGTFQFQLAATFDAHEWDQIEAEVEKIGQEFKRQLTQHVHETANRRVAEVAQLKAKQKQCVDKSENIPLSLVQTGV